MTAAAVHADDDITVRVGARDVIVRPLRAGRAAAVDDAAISELFRTTVLLGRPVEQVPARFDDYEELCLGWYLDAGRTDAGMALHDGAVVGYALVCTDEAAAARWGIDRTARLAARVVGDALRWRVDRPSRAFYRGRSRDMVELTRTRRRPPASVHAHLNVAPGRRAGSVTVALLRHIDERCRLAGAASWYGEINERAGARSRALQRLGLDVVAVDTNHTMSRLLGERVRRLTVVRRVPDA